MANRKWTAGEELERTVDEIQAAVKENNVQAAYKCLSRVRPSPIPN